MDRVSVQSLGIVSSALKLSQGCTTKANRGTKLVPSHACSTTLISPYRLECHDDELFVENERPRAQAYICWHRYHGRVSTFILSVPTSPAAIISETASRKMKGVMAGTRPRASTLSDNVFTVSHFSLRWASGHAAVQYRTVATEDSGLWRSWIKRR